MVAASTSMATRSAAGSLVRRQRMRKGYTKLEACQRWVGEFTRIPYAVVEKLIKASDYCDFNEITKPSVGDRCYCYSGDGGLGTISEMKRDEDDYTEVLYTVELDDGGEVTCKSDELEVERDGSLPMWGTMWAFPDSADDYWLEELDGIQLMSDRGFRIYESEDFGYVFGIGGAGYDFYEEHWLPLYEARGLKWHDEEAEKMAKDGDKVKITCYGKTEEMEREDALSKYLDCMAHSEGAERDRYVNIYLQLIAGEKECNDEQEDQK